MMRAAAGLAWASAQASRSHSGRWARIHQHCWAKIHCHSLRVVTGEGHL